MLLIAHPSCSTSTEAPSLLFQISPKLCPSLQLRDALNPTVYLGPSTPIDSIDSEKTKHSHWALSYPCVGRYSSHVPVVTPGVALVNLGLAY